MSLPELARAAADILGFLDMKGRPACLIGGGVVSRSGEPRATQDVDLTVLTDFGDEQTVLQELLSRYRSRVSDPERFAEDHRIALLWRPGGVKADVSLATFRFGAKRSIDRSSMWELAQDLRLRTCSAEDLVIYKLVAARPGDIQDIIGIVNHQQLRLDVVRIRFWGRQFAVLKEDPDLLGPFEDALKKAGFDR